jgi:hypothetical protein
MAHSWVCAVLVAVAVGPSLELGCAGVDGLTIVAGDAGAGGAATTDETFQGGPSCDGGQFDDGGFGWRMSPGEACNACHASDAGGGGPVFKFAGTLFAEGHAEDGCIPTAAEVSLLSQAQVVITGADGTSITPSLVFDDAFANGNFSSYGSVRLPYTAKIVYAGKERAMIAPQTSGDCNTCHTVAGTSGAPGRIALPP